MSARAGPVAVCGFMVLCLILGGSSQIVWQRYLLELLAIPLLAWAAVACPQLGGLGRGARSLLGIVIALLVSIFLQLVPLPPQIWTALPGREAIQLAFRLLGEPQPWLPLSLDPYGTLDAAYAFIPPIALGLAALAFRLSDSWLAAAIVLGTLVSVILGSAQVSAGETAAWLRLYEVRSPGAVGVFSNGNHFGALLVAAIPFVAALVVVALGGRSVDPTRRAAAAAVGGALMLLIGTGIVLNSSLAAVSLFVPVLAMSALIAPIGRRARSMVLAVSAIAMACALGAIVLFATKGQFGGAVGVDSLHARSDIWVVTATLTDSSFPAGTGLGTFARGYAMHENPASIGTTFVNHAHNDYLEFVTEMGLPGLGLLLAFGVWWIAQAVRIWRNPSARPMATAATIASAAILLHSAVDYPLRTAAIAGVFAACLAIMVNSAPGGDWGQRHVRIA